MVLFKGFPPLKALRYVNFVVVSSIRDLRSTRRYIVAQIFGAYIACLIIYAQYRDLIVAAETGLAAVGALNAIQFTPNGPAGIFALYAMPGSHLGRVFLNEFVTVCASLQLRNMLKLITVHSGHFLGPGNLGSH